MSPSGISVMITLKRKIRCPKCRCTPDVLIEYYREFATEFPVSDDGERRHEVGWHSTGDPYRVDARCAGCTYQWRLRGVKQITDLDKL